MLRDAGLGVKGGGDRRSEVGATSGNDIPNGDTKKALAVHDESEDEDGVDGDGGGG